jgi:trimethylamine-N-oxide reductase cytochrome c-type subunit TorC
MAEYGKRRRMVLMFLILSGIVIAILARGFWYTGKPAFCRTCHEMTTFYVSWIYSTHSEVAECLDCHAGPGIWDKVKAHLNGARYLWSKVTGESRQGIFKATVANISCLQCHQQTELENSKNAELVAHQTHLKRDIECTKCHENMVHGTFRGIKLKPPIEVCINCHREEAIPIDMDALTLVTQHSTGW